MKQRTRKLLTLLLIAAMVMSLAVPAFADNTVYSETPYTYDAGDYTFGPSARSRTRTRRPANRTVWSTTPETAPLP